MAQDSPAPPLLPWPDVESTERPGETVRRVLDYICWISKEMRQVGFHSGPRREEWSRRVHQAYVAIFVPTVHGFGDPYPPDVPPPQNPGIWPDIPAAAIPGMTLRHQLTVIGMLARELRGRDWLHARPGETQDWDRRLARVRAALDHGETLPMPEEEGTEPAPEVLEAAAQQRAALQERAKRRALELRRQMARLRREKAAAKKKKAVKKKAVKKKAPKAPAKKPKKAAAPKKKAKAAAKKVAKKKAKAAKKKPVKAARKKAPAKKKAVKKKKAAKKKAAKRKAARR